MWFYPSAKDLTLFRPDMTKSYIALRFPSQISTPGHIAGKWHRSQPAEFPQETKSLLSHSISQKQILLPSIVQTHITLFHVPLKCLMFPNILNMSCWIMGKWYKLMWETCKIFPFYVTLRLKKDSIVRLNISFKMSIQWRLTYRILYACEPVICVEENT